jgi:flagellar basal-body rod protein FlgB
MIDRLFASPVYEGAKKLLDVSLMRQEALTSNIANIETPGYKRVDIQADFSAAFAEALKSGGVRGVKMPEVTQDIAARSQRKDGNNVVLDEELMQMGKNVVEYEALTDFVSGSLRQLRVAISGKSA